MALFPQGASQVDARCNAGERRVLHQLKRCLEDDYLVWHDVPIGPRARQPDFVILSPRWGLLLLEVKDWKRSTLGPATRDAVELITPHGRVTQPHPLRQARDVVLELVDLMKTDPALVHADGPFAGRLLFPYGHGVVCSRLTRAELAGSDFGELFPEARTLLRDDLDESVDPLAFQHRLWGMFTVSYPHNLTLPQRDRIRWHLFPEVRLQPQATLPFDEPEAAPLLPSLMEVLDLQQEQIARTLGEGHRVIHGAAGSGKTMILIFRAAFLAASARPTQPVLVLCINRSLADGATLDEIAVLCRTKAAMRPFEAALRRRGLPLQSMNTVAFRRFDWRSPGIKLLTMHSAKGLEFGRVFVAGLQALPLNDEPLDEALRLLYVAMTRATRELVLSAHGSSPVVQRVQQALLAVARRFAAEPGRPPESGPTEVRP